ncbi:MAG: zinc-binding dehydrogenase [Kofleriaceae bacterium]
MHAIQITRTGEPDVLQPVDLELPAPGPDELRVTHTAIGINFVDTYHRRGTYPIPLPAILGVEAAGTTSGRRIAYAGALGAYATERNLPAWRAVDVPAHLTDHQAAITLARGITGYMLLRFLVDVKPGMTILVHAAAGGLGSLLVRWAKQLGATVIGTVGTREKAAHVIADQIIVGRDAVLPEGIADVVYDGIGGTTLARSFVAAKPFGTVVSLGQAGGAIPPIDVRQLSQRSLSLSRPSVMQFMTDPARYRAAAREALAFAPAAGTIYALADVARAHRELEAGLTTGAPLLVP